MQQMSPKYRISLIDKIADTLWNEFRSYSKVLAYIKEWNSRQYYDSYGYVENFTIEFKDKDNTQIDLLQTLSNMPGELTLKVAIDLGIETPDYIPSIPEFRNEIKNHYHNASDIFEKAFHEVEHDPSLAIGLANSSLESILKDACIALKIEGYKEQSTLSDLIKIVIKRFRESNAEFPNEIRVITNHLYNAAKSIEDLRSDKTTFHGKSSGNMIICDPSYAYFIVNATATIGLFIINFQKNHFVEASLDYYNDMPF